MRGERLNTQLSLFAKVPNESAKRTLVHLVEIISPEARKMRVAVKGGRGGKLIPWVGNDGYSADAFVRGDQQKSLFLNLHLNCNART